MKRIGFLILLLALACGLKAQSTKPYIVADFAEKDLPTMLALCRQGGFETLVVRTPFATLGHYEWDETFAPEGDKSVRRMVETAATEGITLGVMIQEDVISLNDAFFTPKYYHEFQHSVPLVLFDELTPDDIDIPLRRNDLFKSLSALNLLLIDDEVVSFGTMELAGDLVLLHHCTRGMFGTKKTAHKLDAKVYRVWDTPDRNVIPDGELRQMVRQQLADRLAAGNVTLVLRKDEPGQEILDRSIRVRKVESWEREGVANNNLGWFLVHPSDKKRAATTMTELEWVLSKAAAFNASYGFLVDLKALTAHGLMDEMLETMRQWNLLIQKKAFTSWQKETMKDPYLDWRLERQTDSLYRLHPWSFSRRYQCQFQAIDTGLVQSEVWQWNAEEEGRFGLWLQVEGKTDVVNPMVNTSKGLVMFPCTVKPGQLLEYHFSDSACIMDANLNRLKAVAVEGLPELAKGDNEVSFLCEVDPEAEHLPVVTLRYITRNPFFLIHPYK